MNTTILTHPRVIGAIVAVLRFHGFRKADLPDGIAEVQTRTLEWARDGRELPTDPGDAASLCETIAINWCIDEDRKRNLRQEHDLGLCQDPDNHGPVEREATAEDPVDVQRKLQVFVEDVRAAQMPPHAEQVAVAVAEGKTQTEIAQELGVSEHVVHHTVADLRKRFKAHLASLGLLVLTVALVVLFVVPMGGMAARPRLPGAPDQQRVAVVTQHQAAEPAVEEPRGRDAGTDAATLEQMRELEAKPSLGR